MQILNDLIVNGQLGIDEINVKNLTILETLKLEDTTIIDPSRNAFLNNVSVASLKIGNDDVVTANKDMNAHSILCTSINADEITINNPFNLDTINAYSIRIGNNEENTEIIDSEFNIKNVSSITTNGELQSGSIGTNSIAIDGNDIISSNRQIKNTLNQSVNFNEDSVSFGTVTDKETYNAYLLRNANVVTLSLKSYSRTSNWTINDDGSFNKEILLGKLPSNYSPSHDYYITVTVNDTINSDIDSGIITGVIKTNGKIILRSFIPAKSFDDKVSINKESILCLNATFVTSNSN